jgi:hypothetical protein
VCDNLYLTVIIFREPVRFFFRYSHMFFDYRVSLFPFPFVLHYYQCSFWVNGPLSLVNEFSDAAFHQLHAIPPPHRPSTHFSSDLVRGSLGRPSDISLWVPAFWRMQNTEPKSCASIKRKGRNGKKNAACMCRVQRISIPRWNLKDKN